MISIIKMHWGEADRKKVCAASHARCERSRLIPDRILSVYPTRQDKTRQDREDQTSYSEFPRMMHSQHSNTIPMANNDVTVDANSKIIFDLQTVTQKIHLCRALLQSNSSDERLSNTAGFLEACAPRMIELIEAGSQGFLSEATLVQCLEVNDQLCKILSEYQEMDKKISSQPTPPTKTSDFTIDDDLRDLLMDADSPSPNLHQGKSTGLADEDFKPMASQNNDDSFDSFFDQRFHSK